MNTRLTGRASGVTEQVTGVDLVRAQLLVASGEPLPWRQQDLTQRGHAIEARVYAEDPAHGFLPQAGRLLLLSRAAHARESASIPACVRATTISVHYDPLSRRSSRTAETRDLAIARLVAALRAFPVLGIVTNIPFLIRDSRAPELSIGEIDTGFLDHEGAALADAGDEPMPPFVAAASAAASATPVASHGTGHCGLGSVEPAPGWRP